MRLMTRIIIRLYTNMFLNWWRIRLECWVWCKV